MNDTQVDVTRCYASGCPCAGSLCSDASSDKKRWYCPTHYKRPSATHPGITFHLNRLHWLVGIIDSVRQAYKNDGWDENAANYIFGQNNRNDLKLLPNEATSTYLRRLEAELRKCCLVDDKNGQPDLNSAG